MAGQTQGHTMSPRFTSRDTGENAFLWQDPNRSPESGMGVQYPTTGPSHTNNM